MGFNDGESLVSTSIQDRKIVEVRMGEIHSVSAPDRLRAILGSCIGVALYDATKRIGSMAHVVLPEGDPTRSNGSIGRFATTAIPGMIDQLRELAGGLGRIRAKIAGGASLFAATSPGLKIGELNISMVETQLRAAGIPIIGRHLGGERGRRITFDLESGEVVVEIQGKEVARL